MSYRGVTNTRPSVTPKKRSNTSPSKTEDFDAQFSDFTSLTTTSSGSKRQRTSSGGRFKAGGSDLGRRSTGEGFKPPPPRASQTILPSQKQENDNQALNEMDFDWGDDDVDFMIAISQLDEDDTKAQDTGVDEETLKAMTMMLQDEDFDGFFDPPPESDRPEVERLNQKIAIFKKPEAAPLPPSPVPEPPQDQALALARRLQHKAQGEASWLRKEMEKREKEFDRERKRLRDQETDLKEQLNEEKAKVSAIEKKSETQSYFFTEEKREMKERLEKYEKDSVKGSQRKNLSDIVNSSATKTAPAPMVDEEKVLEAEPVMVSARRGRLELGSVNRSQLAARTFCTVHHESPAELKISLLGAGHETDIQDTLKDSLERITEEISHQPAAVSLSQLSALHGLVQTFTFLTSSRANRALITESCSRLLQRMITAGDALSAQMVQVIQMVGVAWTPRLLTQDITGDIITRISELVSRVKADQVTSKLINSIYSG